MCIYIYILCQYNVFMFILQHVPLYPIYPHILLVKSNYIDPHV